MNKEFLQCKVKQLNINQRELAKDLCVSEVAVSLWISGKRDIPEYISKLFCLVYGFEYKKDNSVNYDNQPDLF